jgi:thiol-disulfide isomerase/thioredoxin
MNMKSSLLTGLIMLGSPLAGQAIQVGSPAPDCNVKSFADGSPSALVKPGKVTYVDFWASWCGPCAKSMPFLDKMNSQLKSKGFEVIGVNLDEDREDADEFLKKHPVKFAMVSNPDGECPSTYGVQAMPSSYLIDRHGKVRHVQLGFRSGEEKELRGKVDSLLTEP